MNKGFALSYIVISIAVLILIGGGSFLFFKENPVTLVDTPIKVGLEDAIKSSLGINGQIDAIDILNRTNTHVRGTYAVDGDVRDFYAVFNNGWYIVSIEAGNISCQRARALSFPESFITNCDDTHSGAKTVKEVSEGSVGGDKVTVIGIVNIPSDPSRGRITLVLNDSEVDISIIDSSNGSGIQDGEVIVVTGTVLEEDDGSVTVVVDEVENFSNNNNDSSNNNNSSDTDDEESSDDIIEPQAPDVDIDSYFFNIFDINNSGIKIQIKP